MKSASRDNGFEGAFVLTGNLAFQDDKNGEIFESDGLDGVRGFIFVSSCMGLYLSYVSFGCA